MKVRGGHPGLSVPKGPYGLCGRKTTLNSKPCSRNWAFLFGLTCLQNSFVKNFFSSTNSFAGKEG